MTRLTFSVPGDPTGKGRPRVCRNATFTPAKTKAYQGLVRAAFACAYPKLVPSPLREPSLHEGPVRVEIVAYYRRPKSHYGTGKNAGRIKQSAPVWPLVKPDFDNVEKAICDALNGLAYSDDSQIVDSHFLKVYQIQGAEPCVMVSLYFMEQETIADHAKKGEHL